MCYQRGVTVDRDALLFIAEGVTELAGFGTAAISVVRGEDLETVAVVGDELARKELEGSRTPTRLVLAELEMAEDWGPLKFVPHERDAHHLDGYSYIPPLAVHDSPDAWHPRDLLCAMLTDDEGRLRGMLSVDVPHDGMRPGAEQRRILEVYARQAGRAVITLLERDELDGLAEHRGQLIDVLSHQLQNPVAAISGNLELLLQDLEPGDPSERGLRAIERATARIISMVADLLSLAGVDDPDRPLVPSRVDLGEVARDAVDLLAAEAGRSRLTLSVTASEGDHVVEGDRAELDAVVTNLVSNAVKYSWPGGVVSVSLDPAELRGQPAVALAVRDRGIGIGEHERHRIFEEFYRSGHSEVRSRPGTGLGLAIVDRVVRRHRGHIELDSHPGEGSTFTVRLPVTYLQ